MISTRIDTERIFDTLVDTSKIYVSMKTSFKIRTDLNNKDGLTPVYLHITAGGKRERVNTDVRVNPITWDKNKERVKAIDKQHKDLNLMLDNIDAKVSKIRTTYRLSNAMLTSSKLKEELTFDMPRINFISFMKMEIEEEAQLMKEGTMKRYRAVVSKLETYNRNLHFLDIDENFFKKYRSYLKRLGNKNTTINANIIAIKKYLRRAKKAGINLMIDIDDIKGGSTKGNKSCLNPAEVKIFLEHFFSRQISGRKKAALGYFLFACTTGLRISDIEKLERKNFTGNEASFSQQKTSTGQIITLNNTAIKIINECEDLFVVRIERNTINRWMKILASKLEVRKHIHMHIGRHTFATNFLRAGGQVHHLNKLLGHKKIETTMQYVHLLAHEANKEITLLDNLYM